jgi:uncharacterized membrane protein
MPRYKAPQELTCEVCGKRFKPDSVRPLRMISAPLLQQVKQAHPHLTAHGYICLDDLMRCRLQLVQNILAGEKGELENAAKDVLQSLQDEESLLARDVYADYNEKITIGERIADRVATFGGSWAFIMSFGGVLFLWILFNSLVMLWHPFDPFPYILLNLVLSCLASIQAPVIMMSQNRKEAKDRLRSENDYRTNLKAELEIRGLHNKIDLLISHQWQRLLEIQEIQTEMLESLAAGNQHGSETQPPA